MKQIEPTLVGNGFLSCSTETFYLNQIGKSVYSSSGKHLGKVVEAGPYGIECGRRLFGTGPWIDRKRIPVSEIDYFEDTEIILNPKGFKQRYA